MDFYEVLDQIIDLLRQRGRVSYQALKRQFDVDDAYLEDLRVELIEVQELAADRDGKMLVWSGEATRTPESIPVLATSETVSPSAAAYAGPPIAHTPPYLAEKILTSRSALEGERKQVTVLFADIKDSTELIRDLDPEEAQKLLDPAIHIMMEAIHRFEGTVNQVLGDGIMSIFGAPIAHEDHALRACYAALAMQAAMRNYTEAMRRTHGMPLQIRAGLNSGEVVVRTISSDLHMDYSAVGQATHLAARMEQLATPGSIVLSGATLRLVEGLIQVNALGPIPVKGMTVPVDVYELTGASSIHRRLQAAVARGLTKFVGRDTEIEALNQALKRAGSGHGQIVAAVGEAGVGKSRLVYEFIHSHRPQGWLVLESASVSYGKATPYFPVIDLLKRYVHVEDGDDARTIRAKVTGQILTLAEPLQDTIPALLSLLDAIPEDNPFLKLDPPQKRQRTLDGLKRILLCESQVQPLVLVFEDLHWTDSETQAFLDGLIESLLTAQLLLLVNYRPEYQHTWSSKTYYTQLRLDPLPPDSASALLETLLGYDPSLEPLKTLLIERTEGNPFFIEEMVRTLVETGALVGVSGAYRLTQDLPMIQVPPTVQAVLAARIDRLPQDGKRLLQTAAVIGTEVPLPLLQAIVGLSEEALYLGLTHLQQAGFLYETSLFPERVYTFKHALTHEVAYGSLLQERRRMFHAQIADVLEALAGDRIDDQVERLAYHTSRGEVWEKAVTYSRQAGEKAMTRSAYREVVGYVEQALSALQHVPENHSTNKQAIDLRLDLCRAYAAIGERRRRLGILREAERLAEALNDQLRLGRILALMTYDFRMQGDYNSALESGQRALDIAATLGDSHLRTRVNHPLAQVYHAQGSYQKAIDLLRQNITFLTHERPDSFNQPIGPGNLSLFGYARLVWCLAELGKFAEGRAQGVEGFRIAEMTDDAHDRVVSYCSIGYLNLRQGDIQQAISLLERGLELCQVANLQEWFPRAAAILGAAYALAGRIPAALPLLEQAVQQATAKGQMLDQALRLVWLCEAYLLAGRQEEAIPLAQQALDLAQHQKERGSEAWSLWLLGKVHACHVPSETVSANSYYLQALTLANELGMRPLQTHCHRGLGTLYSQAGQSEQARTELSTAIEMYRDMAMTFWLPQTEAALTQVA